jgi:hypothetical protein
MSRLKKLALACCGLLGLGTGCVAWWLWPTVEDIPAELEAIDAATDPLGFTLEAQGDLPAVTLRDLHGKTAFFVIEGREAFMGEGEARALKAALNRWEFPADVVGFSVGDAEGFGLMRDKIEADFVSRFRPEARRPLYVDSTGDLMRLFKLPKGHLGLLVLGPGGDVLLRHSGDADDAAIESIREALGATEPPPGPEAPTFAHAGLDNAHCRDRHCVFVFLDEAVARPDVPGIEGGFDGEMEESFARIGRPSVRLMTMLAGSWAEELETHAARIDGTIVGNVEGLEIPAWRDHLGGPSDGLREAFGVAPDEAALVIVDPAGKVAFSERGLVRFWRLGRASEILGIEGRRGDRDEDDE